MGCHLSGAEDWRSLVSGRQQYAHELPGVAGNSISSKDIPEECKQEVSNYTPQVGQYHSSGIHKQPDLQAIGGSNKKPMDVVPGEEHPHNGSTPAGCSECGGRCRVLDHVRQVRLATESSLIQQDHQTVWSHRSGPFCLTSDAQCPTFFSWQPDPYAVATGAFLQDWSQIRGYANPPWGLIGRVLSKVQRDQAQIVLVAPVWKTQPWYPLLLQMLISAPYLIKHNQAMPYRDPEDLVPQLAVWHISGRDTETRSFQRKLSRSCSSHGALRLTSLTTHYLANGIAGVVKWIQIPFRTCKGSCKLPGTLT